ncbi:MAG: leucine-rich repeat protein [Oscillospiraceae bacterium]|nr:leucine-rich repeat protein [Oscillospiraceae bacterium]
MKKLIATIFSVFIIISICASASAGNITLPSSLTVLGPAAFQGDTSISTVTIPEGITSIPELAFSGSSISEIYLPATIKIIEDSAFLGCTGTVFHVKSKEAYDWARDKGFTVFMSWEPQQPVTIIVSYLAGSGTDHSTRLLAHYAEQYIGQPVNIENIGGGSGSIGWSQLANSTPDGYTLGIINLPNFSSSIVNDMGSYTVDSFKPICNHVTETSIVIVRADDDRFPDLQTLVEYGKVNEGSAEKLIAATNGPRASNHISAQAFANSAGFKFIDIPNGSTVDQLKSLRYGEADFAVVKLADIAGQETLFHILGVFNSERLAELPAVPTLGELGYYPYWLGASRCLVTPAGVSEDVIQFYEAAFKAAMEDPDYISDAEQAGIHTNFKDAFATGALIEQQQAFAESQNDSFWHENSRTTYPEKEIRAINPWGAGGATDNCLRSFCSALEKQLGIPITIDNLTGASGVIGHEAIADADPDGYTLGMITWELSGYKPQAMSQYTYENFIPLCRINTDAAAITVNTVWAKENNITDLGAFINYCKTHPGVVTMGCSSAGSVWHVAGGYLMNAAGIELKMSTYYNGSAPAVKDAANGKIIGLTVSTAEVWSYVESGDLTILAIMDDERNSLFPAVPTCKEAGFDFVYTAHRGLALPLGVDEEILTVLKNACAVAIEDVDFCKAMDNIGKKISYLDSAAYMEYLAQSAADVSAAMTTVSLTDNN